jgi:hypothetical protein
MDAKRKQKVERAPSSGLAGMFEAADRKIHDFFLRQHWSQWHPISTAPTNHDLQLTVLDIATASVLPFPCRRTNSGEWINADLGTSIRVQPVKWRPWQSAMAKAETT